jgi:mono/diheme cytochrome c family protein
MTLRRRGVVLTVFASLFAGTMPGVAQQPSQPTGRSQRSQPPGDHHSTPSGWKFRWPSGDPVKGQEAFSKLECYACHEVKGESFQSPKDKKNVGPELSAMGPLHEAEYFAEAILSPSAVIEKGKGYAGPDGSSKMPSFNDSMTVQEAIDLVAYLRSLKPGTGAPAGHRGH